MVADNPLNWKPDITPTTLINPLKKDVIVDLRDDKNNKYQIKIDANMGIITLPKWQSDVVKKHLVDEVINVRELGYLSPEERSKIEKEVEVDLYG